MSGEGKKVCPFVCLEGIQGRDCVAALILNLSTIVG